MNMLGQKATLGQIRHAHRISAILVGKYGREYLPVLLRLDAELKSAEKSDDILHSAVAEYC